MLTEILMLKWIEKSTLKCRDVDHYLDRNVDDKIGSVNDEEL